jgi:hypothetical protein
LDFEEKKKTLREQPKERRALLSAFAYSHFQKAIRSKARALGVELKQINPAFTSLIGAFKYQGLQISSHEKAALAIARRAQGYSEGLNVFQGSARLLKGFAPQRRLAPPDASYDVGENSF